MEDVELRSDFVRIASAHRSLLERARRSRCHCPSAVLNLGAAIGCQAAIEERLELLNRFLDEEVLRQLFDRRRLLLDDLELLESLADWAPDSSDVAELGAVLTRRMVELLETEERAFYRPLLRFGHSPSAGQGVSRRCD